MNGGALNQSILTWVTFLPAIGAVVLMFLPRNDRILRWTALITSLITFAFSVHLVRFFDYGQAGFQTKFDINRVWIAGLGIHYHLGVDGISMWLVLLTAFLVPLSVLVSWKSIHDRVKEFFVLLLLLELSLIHI